MKIILIAISITIALCFSSATLAKDKHAKGKSLPHGLQKKVNRGEPLPPGWQKKLKVGKTLDKEVYDRGNIVVKNIETGFVTIKVEGTLIKLINNTREIVEILDSL